MIIIFLKVPIFYPILIRKIHAIKKKGDNFITLWGNGTPLRELVFSDDLADAVIYFMKKKQMNA